MGGAISSISSTVGGLLGDVTGGLQKKAPDVQGVQIGGYDDRDKRLLAQAALYQGQDTSQGASAQNQALTAAGQALNGQTATQALLNNQNMKNQQNAYSLAASGGQNNAALAQRNAQLAMGNANQANFANALPAAINERNSDIQTLGGLGAQARAGDVSRGQLGLGYENADLGQANAQANIQAGINTNNAAIEGANVAANNALNMQLLGGGASYLGLGGKSAAPSPGSAAGGGAQAGGPDIMSFATMANQGGYVAGGTVTPPNVSDTPQLKETYASILANQILINNRLKKLEGKKGK